MRKGLTDYLRCPCCFGNLTLEVAEKKGAHTISGVLVCQQQHKFPVRDGVPRFVDRLTTVETRTQSVFGAEWTTFKDYQASNLKRMARNLPRDFFSQKLVLDAGCGGGRHAMELNAIWGARNVIGIDISEAVSAAYEGTKDVEGIHIVQASIYNLPFPKDMFDIVFSLGVLQHLPDPHRAFMHLVSYLKPGGKIAIWVYKSSLRKRLLEIPRIITKRLPVSLQTIVSLALSCICYPMVITQRYLRFSMSSHFREYSEYDWMTYRTDWFDRLSAPLTGRYDENDIRNWLIGESLQNIKVSCYGDFFICGLGTKMT